MVLENFENWRKALLLTGKFVPDDDLSIPQDEVEAIYKHYETLVEMADGVFEEKVFRSLVESIQVDNDHEVYENTIRVLFSTPPELFGPWLVNVLPSLIQRQPERTGDFLSLMINNSRVEENHLAEFRNALKNSDPEVKRVIKDFVNQQEQKGWLENKRGYYKESFV